jgi:hypothetical protein
MSYKKYVNNKPIPKFDLGGLYFPYGTTIDDPRNPMNYYAIDYVPLPYMPYDLESELELLKEPTIPKPNLDFGKLREKLDKDLLPAEKEAILSQFDNLVREATQIAVFNPYANFDQNFINLNHKINEFVHNAVLQRAIDNKRNFEKTGTELIKTSDSYALDPTGIPMPITNGQVVKHYTQTEFYRDPLYGSISRADNVNGVSLANNTSFTVADQKSFYDYLDKVTNTKSDTKARGRERGGYIIGATFFEATPIIHTRQGYDFHLENNLRQMTEVKAKILTAFQNANSLEDMERDLLSMSNESVVNSFKTNLQKAKRLVASDMNEYIKLAEGMKLKKEEDITQAQKQLEVIKNKLANNPNDEELLQQKAYYEGIVKNKDKSDVFKFNNIKNTIDLISKNVPKQYAEGLANLLAQEDPLRLQYAIRALRKDPNYAINHIASSPFLRALYSLKKPELFNAVVQNIGSSLEAMDVFVGTNIFTDTMDVFRAQKIELIDKLQDKYIETLNLERVGGGGGSRQEDSLFNSVAYNILTGAGTKYEEEDKKAMSVQEATSFFGITSADIDDNAKQGEGSVSVYRKEEGLSGILVDRIRDGLYKKKEGDKTYSGFVPGKNVGTVYAILENGERVKIDPNSFPQGQVVSISDVQSANLTSISTKSGMVSIPTITAIPDANGNNYIVNVTYRNGETKSINLKDVKLFEAVANSTTQYNITNVKAKKETSSINDNERFVDELRHKAQDKKGTALENRTIHDNLDGNQTKFHTPYNSKIQSGLK